ncbi:MFS transporter [Ilyonectria robusta]|uniref:MFS transporter n=1 Tax=Ilyonectria robusta TaxID=1079257 RepID=UPI001E8D5B29|nr:MFS transporter [Ilyonectria robusta]KAH8670715.1 MFS transporter [Ilyonectria robusta]
MDNKWAEEKGTAADHEEDLSKSHSIIDKNINADEAPAIDAFSGQDDSEANKALLRKQDIRLIPICAMMYLLAYLDRSNIGNAKVMNSETNSDLLSSTGMTSNQYSVALMVFLIAYTIFEAPSNFFLKKLGPSKWFSFLLCSWGTISMCLGAVQNFGGITAARFILGIFEAGLAPGLAYYISFWYRANERSLRLAFIYSTATLAGAFGGLIAYGISHMENVAGLEAWRWLFILEGAPSVLFGIFIFFYLPDYPESPRFLNTEEKELAVLRMEYNGSKGSAGSMKWADAKAVLLDWRLYLHYIVYFSKSCPFSSLSLFAPSITKGLGYDSFEAQLMTVPPYVAAFVVTIALSFYCDKYNKRAVTTICLMLVGAVGFILSACLPVTDYHGRYAGLIIACCGTFATIPILLGWLSANLRSTSAQGLALALNISFGAPGQIAGVWIYKSTEAATGYPTGHWTNGALLLAGAVLTGVLVALYTYRNRRIDSGLSSGQKWAL